LWDDFEIDEIVKEEFEKNRKERIEIYE